MNTLKDVYRISHRLFFFSFFSYLNLLVGKYNIWIYKALSIVKHHHPNALHARFHNKNLVTLSSAPRLTPVQFCAVSLMSVSVFSFVFSLLLATPFLHSQQRKKCSDSSLPPKTSARKHWPSQGKQPWEGLSWLAGNNMHYQKSMSYRSSPSFCHPSAVLPYKGPWIHILL